MYYASTYVRRPKRKTPVTVVTTDGELFDGFLFTTGDQRVKDLLNGDSQFVPFETLAGGIHIINRDMISRVVERRETEANVRLQGNEKVRAPAAVRRPGN